MNQKTGTYLCYQFQSVRIQISITVPIHLRRRSTNYKRKKANISTKNEKTKQTTTTKNQKTGTQLVLPVLVIPGPNLHYWSQFTFANEEQPNKKKQANISKKNRKNEKKMTTKNQKTGTYLCYQFQSVQIQISITGPNSLSSTKHKLQKKESNQ